jgi:hypothetical protein
VVDALDNYYLLGFYPSDPKGSAFRPITVTANRPGLTVRYRRGYVPAARSRTPKRTDPVGELYAGVLPRTDLPVRVFAAALPTGSRNARVVITTEILDGSDRIVTSRAPLAESIDGRRSRVDLEVPLRDLASGPHRLRATVTSGGESVTREIGFVVNAGASRRH